MGKLLAITGKELRSYFVSPVAYSVLTVFTTITGIYFYVVISNFYTRFRQFEVYSQIYRNPELLAKVNLNELVVAPLFQFLVIVLIFIVPAITMRTVAEERKSGTDVLLYTSPLTTWHIILGKFLGSFLFLAILLACTGIFLGVVFYYGNPELGPVVLGWLGLLLIGTVLVAIGLFASSLTENQINAYFISFAIGLLLLITGWAGQLLSSNMGKMLTYLSINEHYKDLVRGLLTTQDLIYFGSFILFFLFLAKQALERA